MQWQKHHQTTAFLCRNLSSCPKNVKTKCYKSIVPPSHQYASRVWYPVTKSNIAKLELYGGMLPGFAAMATTKPAVSLQCCKNLVGRTFNQGKIRKKTTVVYRIITNLLEILQASSHGCNIKKTSSTLPVNILFYQQLQGILLSINSPPLKWSTCQCNISANFGRLQDHDCEQHVFVFNF